MSLLERYIESDLADLHAEGVRACYRSARWSVR